jgi:hypothetical protein
LVVVVLDESRKPDDPPIADGSIQSADVIDADALPVPKIEAAIDDTDGTDDMRNLEGAADFPGPS